MTRFETAQLTEACAGRMQDRVTVINDEDRTIIVVADGAGGMGHGEMAAAAVIREVEISFSRIETAEQWDAELRQIDCRIGDGESTAVIVDLRPDRLCGSSVGDSQAWLISDGTLSNLTKHQKRKPLLGSHEACPVGFSHATLDGLLIVATDGFCNYVKRHELPAAAAQADFFSIPRTCVELVRLPSGELWDDIAVVACRVRPPHRARQRYAI